MCVCVCVCSACEHMRTQVKANMKNGLVGPWSQTSQDHHRENIDSRPRYCYTVGPPIHRLLHLWIQSTIDHFRCRTQIWRVLYMGLEHQ